MTFPDYSEYLNQPDMLEYIESEWLRNTHIHEEQADFVNKVIKNYKLNSVLEIGCATGNAAMRIECKEYTGIDKNEECLKLAREKNPGKTFVYADVREYAGTFNLVCIFATLKHFSLEELPAIFERLKLLGKYLVFDIPIAEEVVDDGTEYHHVWLSREGLLELVGEGKILAENHSNEKEPIFLISNI